MTGNNRRPPAKIVTLIIPAFNVGTYLAKCCRSLMVEDPELLARIDAVVVNDGSTDGTLEIAEKFAAMRPDVFRTIDKANGHYGSCVNAALPTVLGEYVRLLDADDYVDTAQFERYLRVLAGECEKKPERRVDLLLSDLVKVDANGAVISAKHQPFKSGANLEFAEFLRAYESGYYPEMAGITYRSTVFRNLGYRQTERQPYTDNEWITYPMMNVRTFRYEPLSVYRYLLGREGQSMSAEQLGINWICNRRMALNGVRWARGRLGAFDAPNRKYFTRWLETSLFDIYFKALVYDTATARASLDGFDAELAELDATLHAATNEFTYPGRPKIRFVRLYRSHNSAALRLLRLAHLFRGWLSRMRRRLAR